MNDPMVAAEALADIFRYYGIEELQNEVEWLDNWI
jgi:hypothetical protein